MNGSRSRRGNIGRARLPIRLCFGAWLLALVAKTIAGDGGVELTFQTLGAFGDLSRAAGKPLGGLTLAGGEQRIYGTTITGGRYDAGVLYTIAKDGAGYQVLHEFGSLEDDGRMPLGGLVAGSGEFLYGVTQAGGSYGAGTIFRIGLDGTRYGILRSFGIGTSDGQRPIGSLVMGLDRVIYGATDGGGLRGSGTLFRIDPDGRNYQVIHHFRLLSRDGRRPTSLIQSAEGELLGTTLDGGELNKGMIFRLVLAGSLYSQLWSFDGAVTGSVRASGLLAASDGRIYGIASAGGTSGRGTVFMIGRDGEGYVELHPFSSSEGRPVHGLIESEDGHLYGITEAEGAGAGGMVYRLDRTGAQFTALLALAAAFSGRPGGCLTVGSDGYLYGTFQGVAVDTTDVGGLFRLRLADAEYERIHLLSLSGDDGAKPRGHLALGDDGWIQGVTWTGGKFGEGTLFRLRREGALYEKLADFSTHSEVGGYPSSFRRSRTGDWIGTTEESIDGWGSVFRFGKNGSLRPLHRFASMSEGVGPNAILEGRDGKLYGTARNGGTFGMGTFFRMEADGTGLVVLWSFGAQVGEPRFPTGALAQGADGFLYGASARGGTNDGGTLFRISIDGQNLTVLHSFVAVVGAATPEIGFQIKDGGLVGTHSTGGLFQQGDLFRLNLEPLEFESVHSFGAAAGEGRVPTGGVLQLADGSWIGSTAAGGSWGLGTIFRLTTTGSSTLYSFGPGLEEGAEPRGTLLDGQDGFCYGATLLGGYGFGSLFRFSALNPRLKIRLLENQLRLSWVNVEGARYRLQVGRGDPDDWVDSSIPIRIENGEAIAEANFPSGVASMFYRVLVE